MDTHLWSGKDQTNDRRDLRNNRTGPIPEREFETDMNIELEHFEHWLFSKPRHGRVNLLSSGDCLLCQFIKENSNCRYPVATFYEFIPDGISEVQTIPEWFRKLVNEGIESQTTYGEMQDAFRAVFPLETEPEMAKV